MRGDEWQPCRLSLTRVSRAESFATNLWIYDLLSMFRRIWQPKRTFDVSGLHMVPSLPGQQIQATCLWRPIPRGDN